LYCISDYNTQNWRGNPPFGLLRYMNGRNQINN
jgi:hypothetical protein